MFRIPIIISLLFITHRSLAQKDSIPYSKDFEFKEGIYPNFEAFRYNRPIPKSNIVSTYNKEEMTFIADVLAKDYFFYKDSTGNEHKESSSNVWGFCSNKTVYLYFKNAYNRVPIIGSICHFTAYVYTYPTYTNPYYDNMMINTIPDLRQFMIDTKTGTIYEFLPSELEILLKRDLPLYDEFTALSHSKKKKSCFLYIRKYNEKNPLMFPAG